MCLPNGPIDSAYKVIGSMNFPERKHRLETITKKNYELYERLRKIDSTVKTVSKLESSLKNAEIGKRIARYDNEGNLK